MTVPSVIFQLYFAIKEPFDKKIVYISETGFNDYRPKGGDDMDEFEKLLSESKGAVERFVKFKINNHCDSEDIIQDVCLTALQRFGTLKNQSLL